MPLADAATRRSRAQARNQSPAAGASEPGMGCPPSCSSTSSALASGLPIAQGGVPPAPAAFQPGGIVPTPGLPPGSPASDFDLPLPGGSDDEKPKAKSKLKPKPNPSSLGLPLPGDSDDEKPRPKPKPKPKHNPSDFGLPGLEDDSDDGKPKYEPTVRPKPKPKPKHNPSDFGLPLPDEDSDDGQPKYEPTARPKPNPVGGGAESLPAFGGTGCAGKAVAEALSAPPPQPPPQPLAGDSLPAFSGAGSVGRLSISPPQMAAGEGVPAYGGGIYSGRVGPGVLSAAAPPQMMAPSSDLLTKLAFAEAQVHHLKLQLEENEERCIQRLADAKKQSDAELARMEAQCRMFEAELDRQKEIHVNDMRQANETKQARVQQLEKMLGESEERCTRRLGEARQENERMDLQCRRLQAELDRQKELHDSVLRHLNEAKQVDKSIENTVRERQLEIRERNIGEREAQVSKQAKDVEEQWQRVAEMNRHMEDSQHEDHHTINRERERLEAEHARLLELQKTIREADRNNKETSKHAWAQLEDERRAFTQERLQVDGELNARREEIELQERQVRTEGERLKALHLQVETARQNAARRIRETEAVVTSERRCLLNELEVFEEKKRAFDAESTKFEAERLHHEAERRKFEEETQSVGHMAAEVQRRSEEVKELHVQVAEAHAELQRLRSQLADERTEQGNELEKLRMTQKLIEQQRLQLLQTENEIRLRGIEDVDLLVSTSTSPGFDMSVPVGGVGAAGAGGVGGGGGQSLPWW